MIEYIDIEIFTVFELNLSRKNNQSNLEPYYLILS